MKNSFNINNIFIYIIFSYIKNIFCIIIINNGIINIIITINVNIIIIINILNSIHIIVINIINIVFHQYYKYYY